MPLDEGLPRIKTAGEVALPGPRRAQGVALTPSSSDSRRARSGERQPFYPQSFPLVVTTTSESASSPYPHFAFVVQHVQSVIDRKAPSHRTLLLIGKVTRGVIRVGDPCRVVPREKGRPDPPKAGKVVIINRMGFNNAPTTEARPGEDIGVVVQWLTTGDARQGDFLISKYFIGSPAELIATQPLETASSPPAWLPHDPTSEEVASILAHPRYKISPRPSNASTLWITPPRRSYWKAVVAFLALDTFLVALGALLSRVPGPGMEGMVAGWVLIALGVFMFAVTIGATINPLRQEGFTDQGILRVYRFGSKLVPWKALRAPVRKAIGTTVGTVLPYADEISGRERSISVSTEELGLILNFPQCPRLAVNGWVFRSMKQHEPEEGLSNHWE